jgi:hypothetical protein
MSATIITIAQEYIRTLEITMKDPDVMQSFQA